MRLKLIVPFLLSCSVTLAAGPAEAQSHPRPKITGISHLAVYTSDPQATERYYTQVVGATRQPDPENPKGVRYALNATQFVEVLPLPPNSGVNRMDHAGFQTDNAEGLRLYLKAKGWQTPANITHYSDGSRAFRVKDPEGNVVEFVEPSAKAAAPDAPHVIGHHVIHIGFLVHSREAEDKFYRELLGFRPYWYGGMHDDKVEWVSQQTPDSHDWLEYMLRDDPKPITQQTLGVLDHLSIGVVSVPDSYKKLQTEDRLKDVHADQGPKVGKDGKYQFNMYDTDGIRLELMEFHAVEKPCCSEFTAEDPKPE
jgi:catechol 2,3-dioxygenase-like lactoylglutathione lyase family enzyme